MILHCARWPTQAPNAAAEVDLPGSAGREKLVLLHGMGGTGALWRPIAANLEDRFDLLAPDQRGHGQSQIPAAPGGREPPAYTPLDYGRDIVETLRSLHFAPAWFVGHSMGVRTACAAAHLAPDSVRGLVLVDLGFSGPAGGGLGQGLADFLQDFPMRFATRAEARNYMRDHCPDPSIAHYLMAVSVARADGTLDFPFDRAALLATLEAAKNASVGSWVRELGERGMPMLVLRGELSAVWGAPEFEREKAAYADLPSVLFETFAGAGHGLPFEKRAEFIARLERFFDSNR